MVSLQVRLWPSQAHIPQGETSPYPIENTNEPYLDWLNDASLQSEVPQTITTSYGDHEQTVPHDYAVTVCKLFAQLGARGSSVLFSSGDWGVGGGDCKSNDGRNVTEFQPIFPASCKSFPGRVRCRFGWRLTTGRRAFRSLRYFRWRHDRYQARDCYRFLWRRILEILPSTRLPGQGRTSLHQEPGGYL